MCKWMLLDSFAQHQITDAMQQHKQKCKDWNYGDVRKYWMEHDKSGDTVLCVQYDSGNVWHYHRDADNALSIF